MFLLLFFILLYELVVCLLVFSFWNKIHFKLYLVGNFVLLKKVYDWVKVTSLSTDKNEIIIN